MTLSTTEISANSLPTSRSKFAIAALALGAFAIGTAEFATMSFLPAFSATFGVSAPTGGHVVSAYAIGVVVGAPLLAIVTARMDRRRLILLLLFWFSLGNVFTAMAPNFEYLEVLRFLTAIPHGGYFGVATLVAVSLVTEERRANAVGSILMGLAFATVTGVPLANWISFELGWRYGFAAIGALTIFTAIMIAYSIAPQPASNDASPMRELGALKRTQVWLTLAIGAIGFGGMFGVYTFLVSTLQDVTHASVIGTSIILALFGAGITAGNFVAPMIAKRGTLFATGLMLIWSALALAIYTATISNPIAIGFSVFAIGIGGGLGTLLQIRLMEVAGDAQTLAASLNHAAFNVANALGPWLGGFAIAAGFGWSSTGWVGCALAVIGLLVWAIASRVQIRSATEAK